jgi:hypothetical protein
VGDFHSGIVRNDFLIEALAVELDFGVNPLPLLFKALLHGQKGCVFSAGI